MTKLGKPIQPKQPKPLTVEEKVQAIYRQYSQKFAVYMEAAVFNMLGNSEICKNRPYCEIIEDAAALAEQMIDEVPKAIEAAFQRRIETMKAKAEAENKPAQS